MFDLSLVYGKSLMKQIERLVSDEYSPVDKSCDSAFARYLIWVSETSSGDSYRVALKHVLAYRFYLNKWIVPSVCDNELDRHCSGTQDAVYITRIASKFVTNGPSILKR